MRENEIGLEKLRFILKEISNVDNGRYEDKIDELKKKKILEYRLKNE